LSSNFAHSRWDFHYWQQFNSMPDGVREPNRDNSQREPKRLPEMVAGNNIRIAPAALAGNGL
jgi:hypothetical protein